MESILAASEDDSVEMPVGDRADVGVCVDVRVGVRVCVRVGDAVGVGIVVGGRVSVLTAVTLGALGMGDGVCRDS